MDAMDNPSYFTLPGTSKSKSGLSLLKKKNSKQQSQKASSIASLTTSSMTSPRKMKLTRSQSASSDIENNLIFLGNPRPSDIDPSIKFGGHRRSNSMSQRLVQKFSEMDMVHLSGDDDGEVFMSSFSDVKYYNVPSKTRFLGANKRRHSIGGYLHKDNQTFATSNAEKYTDCSKKKFCSRCVSDASGSIGARCGDLIDIAVVSCGQSDTASLWVRYLSSCFQQIAKEQNRPPFKLLSVCVEDILSGIVYLQDQEKCSKARLQVWVICPKFLARLQDHHSLNLIMRLSNVLALNLGVTEEIIVNQHKNTLYNYEHWKHLTVKDQDPTFVGDVLGISMDILSRSWQNQADSEKAQFSVIPKKIKVGQNKLIILMNEPLEADDHIRVTIDKNGHTIEVPNVKRRNPYTLQFAMPACCLQISILATVYVEKNGEPMGHKLVKCESRMRELDQLLRTSDNPLQFLCQTMGISPGDRDQLDSVLVQAMQKNIPPHFNLLQPHVLRQHSSTEEYPTLLHFSAKYGLEKLCWQLLECPGGEQASQIRNGSQFTPADLAERSGYHKIADALKGHLQMTELTSMYTYLKGISSQQGFSDSNYLIPRPLNDSYIIPPPARPVLTIPSPTSPFYSNLPSYQIPPSPVRVPSSADIFQYQNTQSFSLPSYMDNYKIPAGGCRPFSPSASPTEKEQPLPHLTPFDAYLQMQASQSFGISSSNHLRTSLKLDAHDDKTSSFLSSSKKHGHDELTSPCSSIMTPDSSFAHHYPPSSSASSINGMESIKSTTGVQDELIEIINDFKNNVLTISEVEKLVDNWRSRNDVKQSFIEKQAQLDAMRKQYDQIQQSLKERMKRPTPFERIKKFFSRNKHKHSADHSQKSEGGHLNSSTRPISSLSVHSSSSTSSTGRISTSSGTSLGDSGTHSDHDERKVEAQKALQQSNLQNIHFYGDIPFIPKPMPLLTKITSLDEYKNNEKRALCNSCHDYSNIRAHPILRGNSYYQEDTIVEENHDTTVVDVEENNVAIAEIHIDITRKCRCDDKIKKCFCNNLTPQLKNPVSIQTDTQEKENRSDVTLESEKSASKQEHVAENENENKIKNVEIKLCQDIARNVKLVKHDEHLQMGEMKVEELNEETFIKKLEACNIHSIGRNRESFVFEDKQESKDCCELEKDEFGKSAENDIRNNDDHNMNSSDINIHSENVKLFINKFNNIQEEKHDNTILKPKITSVLEKKHFDPEELDNSFEKEFKNSCKEIKNIYKRNSMCKILDDQDDVFSKDPEILKRYDSESTLQLSDVETEPMSYDHNNYVNINKCRSTDI